MFPLVDYWCKDVNLHFNLGQTENWMLWGNAKTFVYKDKDHGGHSYCTWMLDNHLPALLANKVLLGSRVRSTVDHQNLVTCNIYFCFHVYKHWFLIPEYSLFSHSTCTCYNKENRFMFLSSDKNTRSFKDTASTSHRQAVVCSFNLPTDFIDSHFFYEIQ